MTNNLIKIGTLVQMTDTNEYGIVIGNTKRGIEQTNAVHLYNGATPLSGITVNNSHVNVLNTNYVNSELSAEQIWIEIFTTYNKEVEKSNTRIEQYAKQLRTMQVSFETSEINSLQAGLKSIKPKELRKKSFIFDSQYATPALNIQVKEWKRNHATIYLNGSEITFHDISQLRLATKLEVAGRRINAHTMKIGESIGSTQTIVDALDYFDNINKN